MEQIGYSRMDMAGGQDEETQERREEGGRGGRKRCTKKENKNSPMGMGEESGIEKLLWALRDSASICSLWILTFPFVAHW